MSFRQLMQNIIVAGLITLPISVQAQDVPSPELPKANAKATEEYGCVAPIAYMRKNHMKELLHHRDDTMRRGIRTTQYSLAECINCHVTPDATGQVARYGDDKHFCSTCHNYASVSIDCFGCHNDKPQKMDYKHTYNSASGQHHDKLTLESNPHTGETLTTLTSGGAQQ